MPAPALATARSHRPGRPVESDGMLDREKALQAVLGSCRLEGAEPSPDTLRVMQRWAAGEITSEQLGELAKRAAGGLALDAPASPRAA